MFRPQLSAIYRDLASAAYVSTYVGEIRHKCPNIIKIKILKFLKHVTSLKMADSFGGTKSE